MPTGTLMFKGLGVPINGEFEIKQVTLGTDIMTIRGVGSQTGDFIVCRNSSLTEKFVVDKDGNIVTAGTSVTFSGGATSAPALIAFGTLGTTAPSTASAAAQLFLLQDSTAVQLAATNASGDLVYFALSTTVSIS